VISEPTSDRADGTTGQGRDLEDRVVRVSEPGLSDDANNLLTTEVREIVGRAHVSVPRDRPHASEDEPPRGSRLLTTLHDNRVLFGMTVPAGLVVAAVVALLIDRWWLLPVATVVLLLATFGVVALVFSVEGGREQPSATTVALLEEEGVRDPERLLSDVVEEFTEDRTAD